MKKKPDFPQLLKVLRREPTEKPVLFEFIINDNITERFAGPDICAFDDDLRKLRITMHAYANAGYDYSIISPIRAGLMKFPKAEQEEQHTLSLNDGVMIRDWDSLEKYPWPDPENQPYEMIERLGKEKPDGLMFILPGYGGLFENAINITGFENLCMMCLTDEELAHTIFDEIGKRFFRYFDIVSDFKEVGALIHSDDWGFKTQPMFSPDLMEKYVYPWHKKIADMVHEKGKPMILHSCGHPGQVMDPIIDGMKYDGKHSYEDASIPVEDAYEKWGDRIAILGGIDMDFMVRKTPEEIFDRSVKLIEQTQDRGGYALGSGNSIPDYVPTQNYQAMLDAFYKFW